MRLIARIFVLVIVVLGNPIDDDNFKREEIKISENLEFSNPDEGLSYRLPNNSLPIKYDILLTTNIHKGDFKFTGEVKLHIKIMEATQKVTLHYKQINIDKIDIFDPTSLSTPIKTEAKFEFIESHDFLIIDLERTYDPNTELLLDIKYNAVLNDDAAGFYHGNYRNENGVQRFYATTHFEPIDARQAFPCYDEPGIRAVMVLTIIHDKSYTALSSMEVDEQTAQPGDYFRTKFKPTPVMQTYTLAFIVCDFKYVSATVNTRIPQKIYGIPKAIEDGEGDFAASAVGNVLAKFEEVLGVNYPLNKMDHVAIEKFNHGAMENFGLVIYRDFSLLLKETEARNKTEHQNNLVRWISHEFAHQWFGNIISPQWWQYTWLNEGFATLFAGYIPSLLNPEDDLMNVHFFQQYADAFQDDSEYSWSMNQYPDNPKEIFQTKFNSIGYAKSGCVLRMFMEVMTEKVFLEGINVYIKNNFMKAATPEDLHKALKEAYDKENPGNSLNIDQVMSTWENQAGHPLVTVSVSGNDLVFTQRRYPKSNGEIYSVPITIASKTQPDFSKKTPKLWLNSASVTVPQSSVGYTPGDWMIVNIDQVGYYRVDYDTTLWNAIITQLTKNHAVITSLNRAVLLGNFENAWRELKRFQGVDAIKIISYFHQETDYRSWKNGVIILSILYENLYGTRAFDKLNELIRAITKPHFNKLGYNNKDDEPIDDIYLRDHVRTWNCKAFDDTCIVNEHQKFLNFRDSRGKIEFDVCNALRHVSQRVFLEEINKVLTDDDYEYSDIFLKFFGCTLNSDNQAKLLNVVLDAGNRLSNDERENLLFGLFQNSVNGIDKSMEFLMKNYKTLSSLIDLYETLYKLGSKIKEEPRTSAFTYLVNKVRDEDFITDEHKEKVMDKISENLKWMNENYSEILKLFQLEEILTTTENPLSTEEFTEIVTTPAPDSAHSVILSLVLIPICLIIDLKIIYIFKQ